MSAPRTPVDVAVGVLIRPDGRFLLASRPPGKPYPGYWEFPGGKLEPGESVAKALARELHEELAIEIGPVFPWVITEFDYPHARVRLHFCRVFEWSGELHAREEQQYGFFAFDHLPDGPLLPATIPVLRWLQLPPLYALSAAHRLGPSAFLARLDAALEGGLRLLQFREPELASDAVAPLFREVLARVRNARATMLVNSRHERPWWDQADGVHLTAADLARLDARPELAWVAASVHSANELRRCADLGLDFTVAGPVQSTASHPGQPALGWAAFAELVAATALPVYAIGGMTARDLQCAMGSGAHGVALLSAAWCGDQWREAEESDGFLSVSSAGGPEIE
jgi:8-oxo-dGTP diphosphatase